MNRFFKSIKSIVCCTVVAAMLGSSVVSCSYDDSKLREEIENIKGELADLRASVEEELSALRGLIDGMITVVSVQEQNDGSKLITLSDDTTITVYPKGDKVPANIVTVVTIDGTMYWAMYDSQGTANPVMVNGKKVPVVEVAPQTRVNNETKAIEISFNGGISWIATGYTESAIDSIVKDANIVYSDWQTDSKGNPLALYFELTLVDGSVVKMGMQNGKLVMDYDSVYAGYGATSRFGLQLEDAADFMTIAPMGWECDGEYNATSGNLTLYFTAPTEAQVKRGEAVAEGVAKLMVVFNNGSSAIASIKLSTKPASVNFAAEGAYVEVGYGVDYLLCGMVVKSEYSADAIAKECNEVLSNATTADGIVQLAFGEVLTKFVSYSDLAKGELKAGDEYLFWCVAPHSNDAGDLVVNKEEIVSESVIFASVSFSVVDRSFFDVKIKFEALGSKPYALGYALASEFNAKELVEYYNANPNSLDAKYEDMSYEGSFVELFASEGVKLESGVEYVAWYLAKNDNGKYVDSNLSSWEFSTMGFDTTGDIEIVAGEAVVGYDYVEVELDTEEPHMMIYYTAMPAEEAASYTDDATIIDMLIAKGVKEVTEDAVVASYTDCAEGATITFFAVAVDKDGKIGKPFTAEYTTKVIEYNDLSVYLDIKEAMAMGTIINVSCEGALSYKYIYTKVESTEWKQLWGGNYIKVGEYMLKNPESSMICDTTDSDHALVNGNIVLSNLEPNKEYALVVMALNADGLLSYPVCIHFTPVAAMDSFVYKTDAGWEMGKPELVSCEASIVGQALWITWYIKPQQNCTAYTIATNPAWLESAGCKNAEDIAKYIVANVYNEVSQGSLNENGRICEWRADGNYSRTWIEYVIGEDNRPVMAERYEDGLPGVYNFCPSGEKDVTMVYVTWVDQYGNFHEPFIYDPTKKVYVD